MYPKPSELIRRDSTKVSKKCQISRVRAEGSVITTQNISVGEADTIVSLVFEQGQRPNVGALHDIAASSVNDNSFSVSHFAPEGEGWAELLTLGLTFDCIGLSPGPAAPPPPQGTLLGLHEAPEGEALALKPAPHLADAPGLQPIVRGLAGIAVELVELPGVKAVVWHPALAWMLPSYFRKVVGNWLNGGAFPALGLTTLERDRDGSIFTRGLALMTGQELRFAPDPKLGAADIARIAVRLVHSLIEVEPLEVAHEFAGPDGQTIDVVPMTGGHNLLVTVRR